MKDVRAELVRIDAQGEAHPIGMTASQRMRARAGTFRLLPAPAHVVFMRYTGEDGRRDDDDGAVVLLSGEITAPGTVCDILALLAQTGWRGELIVFDGATSRSMFFDQGHVIGVTTSVREERLGSVLYRYGALDDEELERAGVLSSSGRRFGEAAVELGLVSQEQVFKYIGRQIEEVVFAAMTVSDGTFFFLQGFDEMRLPTRHMVSANALLMEGVTRMDELRYFREKIPSNLHVPVRSEGRPAPAPEFLDLYAAVDGRSSIEDIGRVTGLGEFETTKKLYALLQSKHVSIQAPPLSGGPAALVGIANSGLSAIMQTVDRLDKGDDVRSSLKSFADGVSVYGILFRRAGPDARGVLDPERVAENALLVAAGPDADQVLKQMLHDYLAFALFSGCAAVGPEREAELKREVGPVLDQIRPAVPVV
jgi:hypothetical protein